MKNLVPYLLLINFIIICPFTSKAQSIHEFDSLVNLTKALPDDSVKIAIYDEMYLYVNTNPKYLISHINDAINLTIKLKNRPMEMIFKTGAGKAYFELGEHDLALKYYLGAARVAEELEDYAYLIQIYSLTSDMYISNGKYDKAQDYLRKEKILINQYEPDNDDAIANHYSKRARLFHAQKNLDSALFFTKEVAKISAKYIGRSAAETRLYANDIRNIGNIYVAQKNYPAAHETYLKSQTVLDTMIAQKDNIKSYTRLYGNIGELFIETGAYDKAISALQKSLDYAKQISFYDAEMAAYQHIANVYNKLGDYKHEVQYLKQYHALKDSLFTTDKEVAMTELEANYQIEKKNTVLAQQEAETQKQKGWRNLILAIAIAITLGLIAVIVFYNKIRRNNKLLAVRNKLISEQRNELQDLNAMKDKMFSIVSHDLRNPITTLKTYFSLMKSNKLSPEKSEKYTHQLEQSISQTSTMMDNLLVWAQLQLNKNKPELHELNPKELVALILAEVNPQANLKNISIYTQIEPQQLYANESILEIALRNIITNAIKFSQPNTVIEVTTSNEGSQTILTITDQGIGMSEDQIQQIQNNTTIQNKSGTQGEKGSGIGLLLIIQLLKEINVSLSIESILGQGSKVSLHIPNYAG